MFDNFRKGSKGRIEENTEIRELDEFGQPKPQRGKHDGNHRGGQNNTSGGLRGAVTPTSLGLVGLLVIALLLYLHFTGNMNEVYDTFSSTPQENIDAMFNGIRDTEKLNKQEGEWDAIYDENNLYQDSQFFNQVEKQYIVYVYSGDATLDTPFNNWVENNQKDIPIYKLDTWSILDNDLNEAIGTNEPSFVIVYEQEKGYKVIDSIVYSPNEFDTIALKLDAIKAYRHQQREAK